MKICSAVKVWLALAALLFFFGCGTTPKVPRLADYKIPPPPLSSSIEIRRAAAVVTKGTPEVKFKTIRVVETITEIQKVVDPEISEQLEDVKFQLNENVVKLKEMEDANLVLNDQIKFKEGQEVLLRDWGINQQNESELNSKGWIASEDSKRKIEKELILVKDSDNRKSRLVSWVSGGALFFLGLRFVQLAVWQTWLFPVAGAVSGWYFSRFIL